jgi:hypothetical protein
MDLKKSLGLAEKISKTQQTVLVNRSKVRVRSAKRLRVGSRYKISKRSMVELVKDATDKTNLKVIGKDRGRTAKLSSLLLPSDQGVEELCRL